MNIGELYRIALDILVESLKYPTVVGEAYEDIVDFYAEKLEKYGVHVTIHRVPDDYIRRFLKPHHRPEKPRYILIARVGSGKKVLQFNGHYDVVEPGEGWKTNPFHPVIIDGKVYGRGASDMKGGIAAILSTMIYFASAEDPGITVEAAIVPDEEIGGLTGTGYLVNELGSRPAWVVIAEPSGIDNIYVGHRGAVWGIVKVFGRQAHGSTPWKGDNAFLKMVDLAKAFYEAYVSHLSKKKSTYIYEDENASVPTVNLGGLLLSPGSINVVPGIAGFSVDRRLIVEEKADVVVEEMVKLLKDLSTELGISAELEVVEKSDPAVISPSSTVVETLSRSIKEVVGLSPRKTICVGGLDMKYYLWKNIEAVAYGPGSVDQAHRVNEYIEVHHLYAAINVYIDLVRRLALLEQ